MKSYADYLQRIKDREQAENNAAHAGHDHSDPMRICMIATPNKMTFDYSVEIMGMMMEDFLCELHMLHDK